MSRYVLTDGSGFYNVIFSEVDNVIPFPYYGFKKGKNAGWLFYRVSHSKKLGYPLLDSWNRYNVRKWGVKPNDTVLILNNAIWSSMWNADILLVLKEKGCKIALLMLDSMDIMDKERQDKMLEADKLTDAVYTFDFEDAKKYGWKQTYQYYSKITDITPQKFKSDVFCVMRNNGRLRQIVQIYDILESKGVNCSFFVYEVSDEDKKEYFREKITYNHYLTYQEIMMRISQTKVLLELVKNAQRGITLRAFESVVYNKRLITNCPTIKQFPFYDEEYIKTYSNIADIQCIDFSFFTSDEMADYHYQGEFSPVKLFEEIEASVL